RLPVRSGNLSLPLSVDVRHPSHCKSWRHKTKVKKHDSGLHFDLLISAASGSERGSQSVLTPGASLATARGTDHSCRSTVIGSSFVARRAGAQLANPATSRRSKETKTNVAGSVGLTP